MWGGGGRYADQKEAKEKVKVKKRKGRFRGWGSGTVPFS